MPSEFPNATFSPGFFYILVASSAILRLAAYCLFTSLVVRRRQDDAWQAGIHFATMLAGSQTLAALLVAPVATTLLPYPASTYVGLALGIGMLGGVIAAPIAAMIILLIRRFADRTRRPARRPLG